jgi:hypothetical protein
VVPQDPQRTGEGRSVGTMETNESIKCETCGETFVTTKAVQRHEAMAHLRWTRDSRGIPGVRTLDAPGTASVQPFTEEIRPAPSAPDPGTPLLGSGGVEKAAIDDPVQDRNGRSPNFPGKQAAPTPPGNFGEGTP